MQNGGRICADLRELAADLRRICAVDGLLRGFCFGLLRAPATPFGRGGKSNFFPFPSESERNEKTWIWQGEKIGGGLDESGAQNQRTRSCLTTCYQQRRETYAGRCVTNRGERRGDCSEIYLHSLPFGARQTEGLMDGLEGGEPDGRRRRKQAVRPTTGEQAHRQKHGRTERWTDQRKLK